MKKLTTAIALCVLLFALLFANSCRKQSGTGAINTSADSNQVLIQSAISYMDAQNFPVNPIQPRDTLTYSRASLHKTPLWNQAQVQTFSFGKGVVVPISVSEPLSIRVGAAQTTLTASQITWLFMYQDASKSWHIEVVTRIPGDSSTTHLPQKVRVEDWSGNFLKAFLYAGDSAVSLTSTSTYQYPDGIPPAPVSTLELPVTHGLEDCNVTDWYGCSTIGDGPVECSYVYTSEDCLGYDGGAAGLFGGGVILPDLPGAGDYGTIGSFPTGPQPTVASIIPDATVTGNPIVACVWNHLMSPTLTNGLKSILSSFDDNTIYNVDFTVSDADTSADGMCQYKGNNTFLITINGSEANDPDYSRIYLASIFIHEAFHAKLRQKAIETFGELTVSQWPTNIDDMTLSELESYFEADAKSANIWESAEHDWMVNNIAQLATSLEEFVQTYYPTTYAAVGSDIAPYEALMYMGLQNSTLYQEQVVATGLQANFLKYWGELNEGGKCSN